MTRRKYAGVWVPLLRSSGVVLWVYLPGRLSCLFESTRGPSSTILGLMEVRFPKWFLRVKKGVINLFLCISMAYNVISCIEIAKNTQTLKIADFTM